MVLSALTQEVSLLIVVAIICGIIMAISIFLTIGYFIYAKDDYKGKFFKFIFHDVLHYHQPKDDTIVRVKNEYSDIEYVAVCKHCNKTIGLSRKNSRKNKWREIKKKEE